MINFFLSYLIFVVIDAVWLTFIARNLFVKLIPFTMDTHAYTMPAALGAWLLLHLGIWAFVIPLTRDQSMLMTVGYGALFGACAYGVYELTNWAIFSGWSPYLVAIDTAWGAFLCALMSVIVRRFFL